jgi:energy-coupling factor transporter ATP-binding protein EcfA2
VSLNRSTDAVANWRADGAPGAERTDHAPPPDVASPAVHTIELRKDFRGTVALRGLSMTVGRGEVFGFLGPNGAGKTTAVKLLLGLIRPSSGEAMVLGAPAGDRETRRRIGYLPELFRYQSWLSAREVLTLHCQLLQLPRANIRSSTEGSLETVGSSERGDDKVGTFSKCMQQRLGLGVALLGQPELVILDEPTSALDPLGRASSVRLKVGGLGQGWWAQFGHFGTWTADGEWLVLEHMGPGRVPALVDAIVAIGGRVEAVVPEHRTLEERFIELLSSP